MPIAIDSCRHPPTRPPPLPPPTRGRDAPTWIGLSVPTLVSAGDLGLNNTVAPGRAGSAAPALAPGDPSAADRAPAKVNADGRCGLRVELAVEIGIEVPLHVFAAHWRPSTGAASFSNAISRSRARASRDITVPIGTRTTSAMSLQEK